MLSVCVCVCVCVCVVCVEVNEISFYLLGVKVVRRPSLHVSLPQPTTPMEMKTVGAKHTLQGMRFDWFELSRTRA